MCFLWRLRDDPSGFTVVEMLLSLSSVSSFSLHDYQTMAKGQRVWDDGVTGRMCMGTVGLPGNCSLLRFPNVTSQPLTASSV